MKHLIFCLALSACPAAYGLSCGDAVSGTVTLTNDLVCINQSGLTVSAANTTINLNGHFIVCTGAGFAGSCQNPVGGPLGALPVGIGSTNFDNVTIQGPGIIAGFWSGILLNGGTGLVVQQVHITGPLVPLAQNFRGNAFGIHLQNINCPISDPFAPEHGTAANIFGNTVQNQVSGILLADSNCVQVYRNTAIDNNGANGNARGIAVAGGGHNSIYRNIVNNNGLNRAFDSGIAITHTFQNNMIAPSDHNIVFANVVNHNCGDGIATDLSGNNTNIFSNTAKFNGIGSADGQCEATHELTFHDLAELGGSGNTWNPSNLCHTQTSNIPAGVCSPIE
jgi:hypothetical protein